MDGRIALDRDLVGERSGEVVLWDGLAVNLLQELDQALQLRHQLAVALVPGAIRGRDLVARQRPVAGVAEEEAAHFVDVVEDLKLGPLGVAARAVVVLLLLRRPVEVLDLLRQVPDPVLDGVDGRVHVDIVVVAVDRSLLALARLLPRVPERRKSACISQESV